jgi:hypothetical protein
MIAISQRLSCPTSECKGTRRPTDTYCSACKGRVSPWTCPVCATGYHFPTSALVRHCYSCSNTFDRRP